MPAPSVPPEPIAFKTAGDLRAWLTRQHASAKELLVRCFKVHAQARGVTYAQALDEALCFGWIDGVRRSLDAHSFSQRFTPRKAKSNWSAVNIMRARELQAEGRMHPAGLAAFRAGTAAGGPAPYSYATRPVEMSPAYAKLLRANPRARAYFERQPPWYRRTSAFWVMSAKREETRVKRLGVLIACSAKATTIPPLTRPAQSSTKSRSAVRRGRPR
jgi:uncharacterized protein YdeI (YjbR/CyaY-like superfamily)